MEEKKHLYSEQGPWARQQQEVILLKQKLLESHLQTHKLEQALMKERYFRDNSAMHPDDSNNPNATSRSYMRESTLFDGQVSTINNPSEEFHQEQDVMVTYGAGNLQVTSSPSHFNICLGLLVRQGFKMKFNLYSYL